MAEPAGEGRDEVGELPITGDQRRIVEALADLVIADLLRHPSFEK